MYTFSIYIYIKSYDNNNNNIQFLETHTMKIVSMRVKSKY